jgi:hypothetical protein
LLVPTIRRKPASALNVRLKFVISAIERLILDQAAREHLKNKSKTGKMLLTFKNAKNAKVWLKRLQAVII